MRGRTQAEPSIRAILNASKRKTELCATVLGMTPHEYTLRKELRDAEAALAREPYDWPTIRWAAEIRRRLRQVIGDAAEEVGK